MAKIEYQRPSAKRFKNARHTFIQSLAACHKPHRIEIALHRPLKLQ